MQASPKESIGYEVVAARVSFALDQRCSFEDQYNKKMKKQDKQSLVDKPKEEVLSLSSINPLSMNSVNLCKDIDLDASVEQSNPELVDPEVFTSGVKKIIENVSDMEESLRRLDLIKGYSNILTKIKKDMEKKLEEA